MAMKEGKGKIEEIVEKEKRLAMKISGKYYSLWSEEEETLAEIRRELKAGMWASFTYEEKENRNGGAPYKNIKTIQKCETPKVDSSEAVASNDHIRSMQKSVALKVAAEFLKACPESIDEKHPVDTLLKVASAIDAWLTLPVISSTKETVKKESRGDGTLQVTEEEF